MLLSFIVSALLIRSGSYMSAQRSRIGEYLPVEAAVISTIYDGFAFSSYKVRVFRLDGEDADFLAQLSISGENPAAEPGDILSFHAQLNDFEDFENGFPQKLNQLSGGVALQLEATEVEYSGQAYSPEIAFQQLNERLSRRLFASFHAIDADEYYPVAAAMLLGDRSELSPELKRDFRRSGVYHLLAVSGLHITILLGAAEAMLMRLRLSKRNRTLILLLLTAMYVMLAGGSASILRAALMFSFARLSGFFRRQGDTLTSLFGAGAAIILISPGAAIDIGFQLSFFASLGLLLTPRSRSRTVNSLLPGIYSTFFTLIPVWLAFGETSLLAPVANLIEIPLGTLALMLSPFAIFSRAAALLCSLPIRLMSHIAAQLSTLPVGVISLTFDFMPSVIIIALSAAIVCGIICILSRRAPLKYSFFIPIASGAIAYICFFGAYIRSAEGYTDIFYINEGGNEYLISEQTVPTSGAQTLVRASGCTVFEISNGRTFDSSLCRRLCHRSELSLYIFTHYHNAQPSAFERLCRSFTLREVLLPPPLDDSESQIAERLYKIALENDVKVDFYDSSSAAFYGGSFALRREYLERSTHPTLSLTLRLSNNQLVYVGSSALDSSFSDELCEDICRADALIFGAHGPKTRNLINPGGCSSSLKLIVCADNELSEYLADFPEQITRSASPLCELRFRCGE